MPPPKCNVNVIDGFFPPFGSTVQLRIFSKENDLKGGLFKIPTNWEMSVCVDSFASKAYDACEG